MKNIINKYQTIIKYLFSSGTSFIIDILLFSLFYYLLKNIIISTIFARVLSSLYNYVLNKRMVFKYEGKDTKSLTDYFTLVAIQMFISAFIVDGLSKVVVFNPLFIKIPVEVFLFVCNYIIQKTIVFKKESSNILNTILLSGLATFALIGNLEIGDITTWSEIYHNMDLIIVCGLLIILVILFHLFYFSKSLSKSINGYLWVMSFIITLGSSYVHVHNATLFFGSIENFMFSVIKMIGFYFVFRLAVLNVLKFIDSDLKESKNKIIRTFKSHPFIFSFIFLSICYSIYLIAFYPGIINYDNANQIKEVLGLHTRYLDSIIPINDSVTLTNFNPLIHTLLIGKLFKLGVLINNVNLGLFLCTLIQVTFVILTYAYVIKFLIDNKTNEKITFFVLMTLGIIPVFPFYAITLVKDVLYTCALLLYVIKLYEFIKYDKLSIINYVSLFMIITLVYLLRNTGLYIILLSLPFLIIFTNKKKGVGLIFILTIALNYSYNNILLPHFEIANTSVREALSVPFQQTARYVIYYEDELSKEDKKIIGKILSYDTLKEDYREDLADPVKNKFNKYYKDEDLKAYFEVWLEGLIRHPGVYIDATINNISGYFNPFMNNWKVYYKLNPKLPEAGYDYHYNDLDNLRVSLVIYEKVVENIPFINIITNTAMITWINILACIILINYKKYKDLIYMIPLIVQILICIVSPANNYFRYIYPSLVMIAFLIPLIKKEVKAS